MYQVKNSQTGELLGLITEPKYIKYDANTKTLLFVNNPEIADGIAVDGQAYNLNEEIIPNAPLVKLRMVDSGEYSFNMHNETVKNIEDIETMQTIMLDQDNLVGMLEDALMDLDNQIAENGGN